MTAGPEQVSGTSVAGSQNINGGTDHINGAVATYADDVASRNAATQNALTLPNSYRIGSEGFWGRIAAGKTTDGGF